MRSHSLKPLVVATATGLLAGVGFFVGSTTQRADAAAGGLLPTVTLPTLPLTLPVTVPTVTVPPLLPTTTTASTTAEATTTAPPTTTTTANGSTPTTPGVPPAPETATGTVAADPPTVSAASLVGAVRLAGGAVSIPVSSVRAPVKLLFALSVRPSTIASAAQRVRATVQVRDSRGYLVRGAVVAIRSVPAGRLVRTHVVRSGGDGRASIVIRLRPATLRRGALTLFVRASDPSAAKTVYATHTARLRIRPAKRR
ncbi:MAG TPA: hypothetical protein VFA30_10835 [Gaiellaceae bacterium]|nr:hypothetical protein [Gaiellaceae bacterium]